MWLIPKLSVILRLAENSLMHGEVAAFIKEQVVPLTPVYLGTYE